jgi:hypothetical protein
VLASVMLSSVTLSSVLLGGATLSVGPALAETVQGFAQSHDRFCAEVQQLLVPTDLDIINRIEPDFQSFKRSKPEANPLTLHQFLSPTRADGLRQLSCKTKSADHLRAVYGTAAAAAPPSPSQPTRSCRDVHRAMVKAIWQEMSTAERKATRYPPHRVMLDADLAYLTGSSWVQSPTQAYVGAEQRLHLRAVRLFAGWEDWRWQVLPENLRGNHYCHLIAPESLRNLMRQGMAGTALDP